MPYDRDDDLPDAVKSLPKERRAHWRSVFNSAIKDHDEESAFKIAWAAVKNKEAKEMLEQQYRLSVTGNRLMLFPRGTFRHPEYGKMEFDDEFFQEIVENFQNGVLGHTKPFIDVDHNHGAAAGWINRLNVEPDGLFAEVEWTPLGKELVMSGQYKYFSPWWGQYKDPSDGKTYDRVLRGGGLTNVPFLKMLPPVQLFEPGSERVKRVRQEGCNFMLNEMQLDSVRGYRPPAAPTPWRGEGLPTGPTKSDAAIAHGRGPAPSMPRTIGIGDLPPRAQVAINRSLPTPSRRPTGVPGSFAPFFARQAKDNKDGEYDKKKGAASAKGGRPMIKSLKAALGLAETAAVAELRQAFNKALEDALTPEEEDEKDKKREKEKEEMPMAMQHREKEEDTGEGVTQVVTDRQAEKEILPKNDRSAAEVILSELGVSSLSEAAERLRAMREHLDDYAGLAIQVRQLSEAVETLKPKAELAERLQAEKKQAEKEYFFAEQIRLGKLAPKDRKFWEEMYALDEKKVRAHFAEKKQHSEVKLSERGLPTEGDVHTDPREKLSALAETRAKEKGIPFTKALEEVKAENRELVEEIANMVGPNGLRR